VDLAGKEEEVSIYSANIQNDVGLRLQNRLGEPAASVWSAFLKAAFSTHRRGWLTIYSEEEFWQRLGVRPPFSLDDFLTATGRMHVTRRHRRGRITDVQVSMKGRRSNRRNPSQKMRQYVMRRDGAACRRCGTTEALSIDHIVPWSFGGPTTPSNLQVLCTPCNSSKGNRIERGG
jgi:5-methylcytosine-specific restriction endonuclease McrA